MKPGKTIRVHYDLYEWLAEMASKNHTSIVQVSREVAKDHKELQYYLAEKKKKNGEPLFSLRI